MLKKGVKSFKIESAYNEFEAKICFKRQWRTKNLRQTSDFMWNSALWESSFSIFQLSFATIYKIYISGERLGTRL